MKKRLLSVLLVGTMVATLFAGCGKKEENNSVDNTETTNVSEESNSADTPLVVGSAPFSSKFSPFFAESGYDQDAES